MAEWQTSCDITWQGLAACANSGCNYLDCYVVSYSSIGHLDTWGAWDFERNNKPCEFPRLKVKILLSQLCVGPSQPKLKCQFQKTSHGKIVIVSTCQRHSREVMPLFAQAEGCNTNIGTMTQGKAAKGDNATSLLECFP